MLSAYKSVGKFLALTTACTILVLQCCMLMILFLPGDERVRGTHVFL